MSRRTIASIRQNENGGHVIVFDKIVTSINLADGTTVDLSKRTLYLNDATERAKFLNEKNFITPDALALRLDAIAKNRIKYEVVAKVGAGSTNTL